MRYPAFLAPGGRIGCIAPSFGCAAEPYASRFEKARERFEKEGYRVVPGPNCFRSDGTGKSSSPENCGAEINRFFTGDECDAILSCGGGETMCEDLPFVDFPAIAAAEPKWFMGYSDNTNLSFLLPLLTDTAAVYGPCAPAFCREHPSLSDAFGVLTGRVSTVRNYPLWEKEETEEDDPLAPYHLTEPFRVTRFPDAPAAFSGRLIGGCLDCLVNLCGTRFDKVKEFNGRYQKDGAVWFLEACDLTPMGIRRALWQLKNAGWFETAKGFLIGRPYLYDMDFMGVNRLNAVTDTLGALGVPILLDLDIGHLPPMMPLVEGAMADVESAGNDVTIAMRFE